MTGGAGEAVGIGDLDDNTPYFYAVEAADEGGDQISAEVSFAIDLTTDPTLGKLLAQVRGERVQLEAPNAITGIILGVETRDQKVGDNQVQKVEFLNLLTDEGLRSVALDHVRPARTVISRQGGSGLNRRNGALGAEICPSGAISRKSRR